MKAFKAAIVCASVLVATPAWAHDEGDKQLQQQINDMQQQMQKMQRIMESGALLDMSNHIQSMQKEMQELRNSNEVLLHELETMKSRQRELYLDSDRRLQDLEAGGVATPQAVEGEPASTAVGTAPVTPAVVSVKPASDQPKQSSAADQRAAYKQAFQLLNNGQYAQAVSAFTDFLANYPDSGYAPNAQYWLGEAYYASRDYEQALLAFKRVQKQYPESNKTPDAALKLGYTYYEMQQWDNAKATLKQIISQYPKSQPANLAKKRLERIAREGH